MFRWRRRSSVGAIVAIGTRRATTAEFVSTSARGMRFVPCACGAEWRGGAAAATHVALDSDLEENRLCFCGSGF